MKTNKPVAAPKHTPGPWTVEGDRVSDVCLVYGTPNQEANARLIAAAPDLLEAAWQAVFAIGAMGANADTKHPYRKHWEQIRAAIAKAEGK